MSEEQYHSASHCKYLIHIISFGVPSSDFQYYKEMSISFLNRYYRKFVMIINTRSKHSK